MSEGQYITVWKAYLLSLVGNWILQLNEGAFTHKMKQLDALLKKTGLRSPDDTASAIFSQIVNLFRRITNSQSADVIVTITPDGLPIITPHVEFGDPDGDQPDLVRHDEALRLLDDVLAEIGFHAWVVLDRLDEAFQGFPDAEIPVLRALLRTYLDLGDFTHITLKLFVRKDLFRRIIGEGFVNLTHINARKVEIVWDEEDLLDLLCRRLRENSDFLAALNIPDGASNDEVFYAVFPRQVDQGSRRPTTWNWILARVRDGNGIAPPRNLIDLVTKAQEAQLRKEARDATEFEPGSDGGVIRSDAIRGVCRLSAPSASRTPSSLRRAATHR